MQEVLLRNTEGGLYGSQWTTGTCSGLEGQDLQAALAAASVPRDYSTVAVTLVKVL